MQSVQAYTLNCNELIIDDMEFDGPFEVEANILVASAQYPGFYTIAAYPGFYFELIGSATTVACEPTPAAAAISAPVKVATPVVATKYTPATAAISAPVKVATPVVAPKYTPAAAAISTAPLAIQLVNTESITKDGVPLQRRGNSTHYKYRNLPELKKVINANLVDYIWLDDALARDERAYVMAIGYNVSKLVNTTTTDGYEYLFNLSWTTDRTSAQVRPMFGANFTMVPENIMNQPNKKNFVPIRRQLVPPTTDDAITEILTSERKICTPIVHDTIGKLDNPKPVDLAVAIGKHMAHADKHNLVVHTNNRLIILDVDNKCTRDNFVQGQANMDIMLSMLADMYDMNKVCHSISKSGGMHIYMQDYENLGLKNDANCFKLRRLDGSVVGLGWDIKAGAGGSANELGYVSSTDTTTGETIRKFYNFVVTPGCNTRKSVLDQATSTVHQITELPVTDSLEEEAYNNTQSILEEAWETSQYKADAYATGDDDIIEAAQAQFMCNNSGKLEADSLTYKSMPGYQMLHLLITRTVVEKRRANGSIYYRPEPCADYMVFLNYLQKTGAHIAMPKAADNNSLSPNKHRQTIGCITTESMFDYYVGATLKAIPESIVSNRSNFEWRTLIKCVKMACAPSLEEYAANALKRHCAPYELTHPTVAPNETYDAYKAYTVNLDEPTYPCILNFMRTYQVYDDTIIGKRTELMAKLGISEKHDISIPNTWEEFVEMPQIFGNMIDVWDGPDMVNPDDKLPWFNSPADKTNFWKLNTQALRNFTPLEVVNILKRSYVRVYTGGLWYHYCKQSNDISTTIKLMEDSKLFKAEMQEKIIIPKDSSAKKPTYFTLWDVIEKIGPYVTYYGVQRDLCARSAVRAKHTVAEERVICPTYPMQGGLYHNPNITAEEKDTYIAFFDRLLNTLSGGPAEKKFLLNWLAHMVQRPTETPNTALYLFSSEFGVGKSNFTQLLLQEIIGIDYYSEVAAADFTVEFTSNLDNKLLCVIDDITTAHMRTIYEKQLKSFITSKTGRVRKMRTDPESVQKVIKPHLIMTSNSPPYVPANDRRVAVMYVKKDDTIGDDYNKYINKRNTDFIYTVYKYLTDVDIDGYDFIKQCESLRAFDDNVLTLTNRFANLTPVQAFIDALFKDSIENPPHRYIVDSFRNLEDASAEHKFLSGDMYEMYKKFHESHGYHDKPIPVTRLRSEMLSLLVGSVSSKNSNLLVTGSGKTVFKVVVNGSEIPKKGNVWGLLNMRTACRQFYKAIGLPLEYTDLVAEYDKLENMVSTEYNDQETEELADPVMLELLTRLSNKCGTHLDTYKQVSLVKQLLSTIRDHVAATTDDFPETKN